MQGASYTEWAHDSSYLECYMGSEIQIWFLKAKSMKEFKEICRTLGIVGIVDLVVEHTGNPRSMRK